MSNPKIHPSLVIGLGGTGTNVVRHVKRRLLYAWNRYCTTISNHKGITNTELPPLFQILAIDTEPLNNQQFGLQQLNAHEFVWAGKFDATRMVQNRQNHQPYLDWWQWEESEVPLGYISYGARQIRAIGRLAFFKHYTTIKRQIENKLRALCEVRAIVGAQERGFPVEDQRFVFIVSSVCGGTGSGMFLDLAHVTRHYVSRPGELNTKVIGIFLMPSVFDREILADVQRRRIRANSYAALKELNHFEVRSEYKQRYPNEQKPLPELPKPAFDQIFIVESKNTEGKEFSGKEHAEQMVAHAISLMIFSHLSPSILGQEVNAWTNASITQQPFVSCSSFGVSAIVIPTTQLYSYLCERAAYEELSDLFTKDNNEVVEEQLNRLIENVEREFLSHCPTYGDLRVAHDDTEPLKDIFKLQEDIQSKSGDWEKFKKTVDEIAFRVLTQAGVSGLQDLTIRLERDLPKSQRPFGSYPTNLGQNRVLKFIERLGDLVNLLLSSLSGKQAQLREDRNKRYFDDIIDSTWQILINVILGYVKDLVGLATSVSEKWNTAASKLQDRLEQTKSRFHPFLRGADPEIATCYELELNAVSQNDLDKIWERVQEKLLLSARNEFCRIIQPTSSQDGFAENLFDSIVKALERDEDVRRYVEQQIGFELIINIQRIDGRRLPYDRIDQVASNANHRAPVDDDTFSHSSADEHPINLSTVPRLNGADDGKLENALQEHQIYPVAMNHQGRIDVIRIVHGLRLSYLSSLADLYDHYRGGEFNPRLLHLQPNWFDTLLELYPAAKTL